MKVISEEHLLGFLKDNKSRLVHFLLFCNKDLKVDYRGKISEKSSTEDLDFFQIRIDRRSLIIESSSPLNRKKRFDLPIYKHNQELRSAAVNLVLTSFSSICETAAEVREELSDDLIRLTSGDLVFRMYLGDSESGKAEAVLQLFITSKK